MNYLFVHQNMPGQFGHLAAHLARAPHNRVIFLTKSDRTPPIGVEVKRYRPLRPANGSTHHYIREFESAVLHGQAAARACLELKHAGFAPDIVLAHPGWGESLYVKDIFPKAKLVNYCEFFYRASGADVGFGQEGPLDVDLAARVRTRNAALMLALEACDRGLCPTQWQLSVHPEEWRRKIEVVFDGVDADLARPDPLARFQLPDGPLLTRADRVLTYVARNLEPYRGFPSFMRALPRILDALPDARIVVVGGDDVSYGQRPRDGRCWREVMTEEVRLDPTRVHFIRHLPHKDYLRLLQISSAHVYLTVPFVLSWSAVEALATGCIVIGSRTPPVEEVLRDGQNGFLVDFFDYDGIATAVIEALRRSAALEELRKNARRTVLGRYDLATCLPRQIDLLHRLVDADVPFMLRAEA